MLLELAISNFAIIEQTTIRFTDGLNALTGETGAGKSILLDALGAVLGARVSSDVVRTGASSARVEAAFALEPTDVDRLSSLMGDLGIELAVDDTLVLSREILASGRSSARINGRLATAGSLSDLGMLLVDIHGQSDHLAILKAAEQRNLLDRYAGLEPMRRDVAATVRAWREVRQRLEDLTRNARDRAQRIDLLRFQVEEIDAAALSADEEASLDAEREVLRNADRLRSDAMDAWMTLAGAEDVGGEAAVATAMRRVVSLAADIASLDRSMATTGERANEILVLAEDLARDLRDYADTIDADEARLLEIEERLALIVSLKRKYGTSAEEVLAFAEQARQELERLSSAEYDSEALQAREAELATELAQRARELSSRRQDAARRLGVDIARSIEELNMGRAQVRIDVSQRDSAQGISLNVDGPTVQVDETGADQVEFLIAPNAGEALKPLARIASGGETARLMLATKSILSQVDLTPTLVFDEIDVGVGGRSGQVVGEKLWGISRRHQVIVVTHLPQIAAFARTHLKIEKQDVDGRTVSSVRKLDGPEQETELAAMLDGFPVTPSALANARDMLARSHRYTSAE